MNRKPRAAYNGVTLNRERAPPRHILGAVGRRAALAYVNRAEAPPRPAYTPHTYLDIFGVRMGTTRDDGVTVAALTVAAVAAAYLLSPST